MKKLLITSVLFFIITGLTLAQLGPAGKVDAKYENIDTPPKSEFKKVRTSLNMVDITYAKAKAKDFNRIELSRRSLDNRRWQVIHTLNGDLTKEDIVRYRDKKIEPGREYIYRLQTIDNDGNKSPFAFSNTVKATTRIPVSNISNLSVKKKDNKTRLTWNYELSKEIYFIVYRTFPDGTLRQIGRCENTEFIDSHTPTGKVSYSVKPMRKDGNRGKMSDPITVQ